MLLLYASELAALIGKNPYKPQWEAFEQLWARFQPEQFATHQEGLNNYVALQLENVQTAAVARASELQVETVQDVQAAEKQVIDEVVKAAVREADARVVQAAAALNSEQIVDQDALLALATAAGNQAAQQLLAEAQTFTQQAQVVATKAASAVRCSYGTAKEEGSRKQLVKASGVAVKHDNRFYSLRLGTMPYARVAWGIGGRLDGLDSQGRVVEIKNRTRRFFNVIPEYERVQVACYLKLTGAPKALVVQQFNGDQRTTEIEDDCSRWQLYLKLMTAVVLLLDLFTSEDSVTLRRAWVECDAGDEKQALLTHWLLEQEQAEQHSLAHG